jgi:hypothetical protein
MFMPALLTRQQLDQAGCGTANCGHDHSVLHLNAGCHSARGLEVRYVKATGAIEVVCYVCEKPIATIKVAP